MGVDRQIANDDGNTALGLAKIMGHSEIIKLLEELDIESPPSRDSHDER